MHASLDDPSLVSRAGLVPVMSLAFVEIDSTQQRVYGHQKEGSAFGYTKIQSKTVLIRGLNALAATICALLAPPVIAAAALGLRRRDRRDAVHRLRVQEGQGDHCPADHPPGPRPEHRRRAGRTVPGPALSHNIH
jgi:hypothetical protein